MTLRTKRILIWSLLGAALVALAIPKLAGGGPGAGEGAERAGGASGRRGGDRGGGGRGAGGPVEVRALVVRAGSAGDRLRVTGTLLPNETVDLQSETAGKVVGIYFREGEAVSAGRLLVKINDADLRAQLKRAQYRRTLSAAREERQRQLLEKKAISPADYDVAISELHTADADIELLHAQIARTEIRAPFAGVVGLRQLSLGAYITPSNRVATLSSTNPLKLEFYLPERYVRMVRPGSAVDFRVAESSELMTAHVYAIEPRIDQSTRTLQVRATVPNPGGRLMAGAFAEIQMDLGSGPAGVSVPSEALLPQPGGSSAVFIARDGKAEQRPIDVGVRTSRTVQVLGGINPGDTVIFSGVQMVKPGGKVRVTTVDGSSIGM